MSSDDDGNRFVRLLKFIATVLYVTFIIVSLAADAAQRKFSTD